MRGLFTWPLFTWSGEVVRFAGGGDSGTRWKAVNLEMLPVVTWWRRETHGATCFVRLGPKATKIWRKWTRHFSRWSNLKRQMKCCWKSDWSIELGVWLSVTATRRGSSGAAAHFGRSRHPIVPLEKPKMYSSSLAIDETCSYLRKCSSGFKQVEGCLKL